MLGEYFQKMITRMNDLQLQYVWFDFHHECRGMKYENLTKLIDSIKPQLNEFKQYSLKYQKTKVILIDPNPRTQHQQSYHSRAE